MDDLRVEMRMLMSGYLDDELDPDERERFERYLGEHPEFRREFDEMTQLHGAASGMSVEDPGDEVWDTFLDGVYNRLERRAGWTALIVGGSALLAWAVYYFVAAQWASVTLKILVALPVVGLTILFVSVLRQRLFMLKTDRYSRDVKR